MKKYNYFEAVCNDVREALKDIDLNNYNSFGEAQDALNELLWTEDSVTGNGSGSYTFSTWEAEEDLCHNWDLLQEVLQEFGYTMTNILEKGPEWCDVIIRCYLLAGAIDTVLGEMEANGKTPDSWKEE